MGSTRRSLKLSPKRVTDGKTHKYSVHLDHVSKVYTYGLDTELKEKEAQFVADSAAIRAEKEEDNFSILEDNYSDACKTLGVSNLQVSNPNSPGTYAVVRLGNEKNLEADLTIYSPGGKTDELEVEVTDATYSGRAPITAERIAFDTIEKYLKSAEREM